MPQQDFSDAERQAIIRAKEMYSRAVPQNSGETVFRKQPNPSEADGRSAGFGSQNPGMNYNNSGYRQQNSETNTRNSVFPPQNNGFNGGGQNRQSEPFQNSDRQNDGNPCYRAQPHRQQRNDSRFFSNPMSFLSGFLNDPDAKLIIAMILLLSGDGGDNLLLMALIYIML